MKPEWIEIKRGDVMPQHAGMHVSMNPRGDIVMNAVVKRMMGEPVAFKLLYDTVNNRIGLKPTSPSMTNAYPALKSNRTGVMVRGHRLVKEQRIKLPHTVQFDEAEIDEDGMLVLDLRLARPSRRALSRVNRRDAETRR